MYGIIYWEKDGKGPFAVENPDGSMWTAVELASADHMADQVEAKEHVECRVVSLEGVHE